MRTARALKPKACRKCKTQFVPWSSLQKACGPKCALALVDDTNRRRDEKRAREKARAERAELRQRREALKGVSEWRREAQAAFNAYIRARDHGKPCVSCGRHVSDVDLLTGSRGDCGHYRSTGAASHLRFNCWNAALQCVKCNRNLSGNVVDYRISLVRRIGIDRLESLENDNTPRTFDIAYLKRVKRIFRKRAKHYKKLRGIA